MDMCCLALTKESVGMPESSTVSLEVVMGPSSNEPRRSLLQRPVWRSAIDQPWLVSDFEVHHAGIALSSWLAPLAVLARVLDNFFADGHRLTAVAYAIVAVDAKAVLGRARAHVRPARTGGRIIGC